MIPTKADYLKDLETMCLIDLDGKAYYIDLSEYDEETKFDIISIHCTIAQQISNGQHYDDYYSKLGWITYGSHFTGCSNRYDVEPTQAQINKIYELQQKSYNELIQRRKDLGITW